MDSDFARAAAMAAEIEDIYPLSPMQSGMLFHALDRPGSGLYFQQFVYTLEGELDVDAFDRAWQQATMRHAVLRTAIVSDGVDEPVQVVFRQVRLPVDVRDCGALSESERQAAMDEYLRADRERGIDLQRAPLARVALFRCTARDWRLVWSHHHLLLDGWSNLLLLKEVWALYEALVRGAPFNLACPRAYRDYIAWLQQQDLRAAETYWREALAGLTAATPPPLLDVGASGSDAGSLTVRERWTPAERIELQAAARQMQVTVNTVVQGAWALLLSRYSGMHDVVFGATISGRPPDLRGVEQMVGLFINTVPVRTRVNGACAVGDWLRAIQQTQADAQQYGYAPLVLVQQWSAVAPGQPLFDSLLILENYPVDAFETRYGVEVSTGAVRVGIAGAVEQTNYALTLSVGVGRDVQLQATMPRARCTEDHAAQILRHLRVLCAELVRDPRRRLESAALLTDAERRQILHAWNRSDVDIDEAPYVHEAVARQAAVHPDAIALVCEGEHVSYAELQARVDRAAAACSALGLGPEMRAGVCCDRGPALVVGLLGVLQAGGAYVPLDPEYPRERLRAMLRDSDLALLVTERALRDRLGDAPCPILMLDDESHPPAGRVAAPQNRPIASTQLAYVLYTSGSTGTPKGVCIEHGALRNLLYSMAARLELDRDCRWLAVTTICFDIAALELFAPLIAGGCVTLVPHTVAADGARLAECVDTHAPTVMQATPTGWRVLLDSGWRASGAMTILCGGEALLPKLARELLTGGGDVWNVYGPTETTIWSTALRLESAAAFGFGGALANTRLYVVDRENRPVPVGVAGELLIGGDGLARGYWRRGALTAERFTPDAFSGDAGARVYRTGDRVRWRADGTLEFLGRTDQQVKIRGYRVELREIEAVLERHPDVRRAAVVAIEQDNVPRLVAYVARAGSPQGGDSALERQLRTYLRERLPEYMLPAAVVFADALPLTPAGKIDRRTLAATARDAPGADDAHGGPLTAIEEIVAGVWSTVLRREHVSKDDNFFELGGHSLLATRVAARVRDAFGIDVPVRLIFDHPTAAAFAARIEAARRLDRAASVPALERCERSGPRPLSFAQQRLWFLEQLDPGRSAYHMPFALRIDGVLDIGAVRGALTELIRRHEILRTRFLEVDGEAAQMVEPTITARAPLVDLTALPARWRERTARRIMRVEFHRRFDLACGPLLRVTLIRTDGDTHVLIAVMHHIGSDGWSMGVLVRELTILFDAFRSGRPCPLEPLQIQYGDYAEWQRTWLRGDVLDQHIAYWRGQLRDVVPLELPTDRPRTAAVTRRAGLLPIAVPAGVADMLRAMCRTEGATMFMTLLAAFQVLLSRHTGSSDIAVATSIANRTHPALESLIGLFVNQLVLRADLADRPTFRQLLRRVRDTVLDAYTHQDLPFEKLVEELAPPRESGRTPFADVMLLVQNMPDEELAIPGLRMTSMTDMTPIAKFDLTVALTETPSGLRGTVEYLDELFEASSVRTLIRHFETMLTEIAADPDRPVHELPLVATATPSSVAAFAAALDQ